MKHLTILIFMLAVAAGESAPFSGIGGVMASNQNGQLMTPTNFFYRNLVAGSNVVLEPTNGGRLIIHGKPGGGGGSADLGVTNLYQIGSTVLTNLASLGVTNFQAGAGIGLAVVNGTLWVTNLWSTNGFVTMTITNGLATIDFVETATNGFVGMAITNGLASIAYVNTSDITTSNGLVALMVSYDATGSNSLRTLLLSNDIITSNGLVTLLVANDAVGSNALRTLLLNSDITTSNGVVSLLTNRIAASNANYVLKYNGASDGQQATNLNVPVLLTFDAFQDNNATLFYSAGLLSGGAGLFSSDFAVQGNQTNSGTLDVSGAATFGSSLKAALVGGYQFVVNDTTGEINIGQGEAVLGPGSLVLSLAGPTGIRIIDDGGNGMVYYADGFGNVTNLGVVKVGGVLTAHKPISAEDNITNTVLSASKLVATGTGKQLVSSAFADADIAGKQNGTAYLTNLNAWGITNVIAGAGVSLSTNNGVLTVTANSSTTNLYILSNAGLGTNNTFSSATNTAQASNQVVTTFQGLVGQTNSWADFQSNGVSLVRVSPAGSGTIAANRYTTTTTSGGTVNLPIYEVGTGRGLYTPSASSLGLIAGSAEVMRVDGTSRLVGIGAATAPIYSLHLTNNNLATDPFSVWNTNTTQPALHVRTNGNVGIGTNAPAVGLHNNGLTRLDNICAGTWFTANGNAGGGGFELYNAAGYTNRSVATGRMLNISGGGSPGILMASDWFIYWSPTASSTSVDACNARDTALYRSRAGEVAATNLLVLNTLTNRGTIYAPTNTAPFFTTNFSTLLVTNLALPQRALLFVQLAFDDVTGGIPSCTVIATNNVSTNNFGTISPTLSGLTLVGTVTITNHYIYFLDTNMVLKVTDTSTGGAAVRMVQSILSGL